MFSSKRISTLFTLLVLTIGFVYADALSNFTQSKPVNASQTAVLIKDLKTGKVLVSHNIDKKLVPASIMKSVTTATLLEKVGPKFKYVTPVYVTGNISNGTVDGNLLVVASGDPTINARNAPKSPDFIQEIVNGLKAAKINKINGSIVIDESSFPEPAINPAWNAADLSQEYGTGTHGFNFENNANNGKAVKEPAEVFKSKLRTALAKEGITIGSSQVNTGGVRKLIVNHTSASIDEIMRACMMRSDNQYAEGMMRLIGQKYGGSGSTAEGTARTKALWKSRKAPVDSITIIDGSGLSRSNKVTARFMVDMLSKMSRNPYYVSFFPLAGQEGTLKHLLPKTRLEGYFAMKTGSMTGIQCYAGYKVDDNYEPTHAVVIIMNGMGDRDAARKEVEKLLLSTFP